MWVCLSHRLISLVADSAFITFTYSLNKLFLRTSQVSGTVFGIEDAEMERQALLSNHSWSGLVGNRLVIDN